MTHFDEMTCLLYLEGQLDTARARELAQHVRECASCGELLHALQHETALLSSALAEDTEALPARLLSEEKRSSPTWAWALGFGAFASGAYWLWIAGISPWFDQISNAGFGGTDLFSMIVFSGAFWEGWGDVMDGIQIGALLVAAIVLIAWIRRRFGRSVSIAVVMSALLFAVAAPPGASAAEIRRGRSVSVPVGETVHNDLVASASSVRIEGTVEGDVIAFTRDISVTGHVTGDVIAFSQEAMIDGVVDGNVRVFSRGVLLQGTVGKNVTAFGRSVDLISKASIGGGMIVLSGDANLDGKIQRDVLGLIGQSELSGLVGGQVWIRGGTLTVASSAEIRGPATFEGPQEPEVESGAKLASPIRTEIKQEVRRNRRTSARYYVRAVFGYAAALVVGIVLLLLLPGFFRTALRATADIGLPIGIGAVALVSGLILLALGILLMFLGTGAGIAVALAYAPVLYVAQVFVGTWLGTKIKGDAPTNTGMDKRSIIARMALGLLILDVARLIPVLGGIVGLAVVLWGSGAVLLGFYRMSRVGTAGIAPLAA